MTWVLNDIFQLVLKNGSVILIERRFASGWYTTTHKYAPTFLSDIIDLYTIEVDRREWSSMHPNVSGVDVMGSKPGWVDDYLRILHLTREFPSLQFLRRIIYAHMTTFSFENISKITCEPKWVDGMNVTSMVSNFLGGHERYGFGGTCYALNWHLKCLLSEIGYDCYTVMLSQQHMGIIVHVPDTGDRKFYVDCGAAAPLFEPVDLESGGHHCACFGNDRVVIRHRISEFVHRFERYRKGVLIGEPWYFNTEQPQTLNGFLPVIQSSYEPNRLFMSSLRCHKFGQNLSYYVSLKNDRFQICYRDGRVFEHILKSVKEVEETVQNVFGIEHSFVRHAIARIKQSGMNVFTHASS
jgi:N-hydroxyarylamine O-acetyltransferase